MSDKEQKAKEYAENKYCSEDNEIPRYMIAQIHAARDGFEAGWHAAMEYLSKFPLDEVFNEIIKEVHTTNKPPIC